MVGGGLVTVDEMAGILKREYGISSFEELEAEIKKAPGIDIGLFTTPFKIAERQSVA